MNKTTQHTHFVGIGGIGMSALALLLKQEGHKVTGSDRMDSALIDTLRSSGIEVRIGHNSDNVGGADKLVYSSAIQIDNPERQFAHKNGIPQIRRAEMLGQIASAYQHTLAIAGTHGKTTTTGMCGQILVEAGVDPSILVGGILPNMKSNLRLGAGNTIILEADEYDRSFLALSPDRILVTTLEADHLDIYSDLQDVRDTFFQFISKLGSDDILVLAGDDQELQELAKRARGSVIFYGQSKDNLYRADAIRIDQFSSHFSIIKGNQLLGDIKLNMPGIHNVMNALGASAIASEMGIDFPSVKRGLEVFKGVERRFELKGTKDGVLFIDDYAHHPTEVRATLEAARRGWPSSRIIAVFQPHLYSRTKDFAEKFGEALELADIAIVTDIYPAREKPIPGVSSDLIARAAENVELIPTMNEVLMYLSSVIRENDLVITLGAGDIWQLHDLFLKEEVTWQ